MKPVKLFYIKLGVFCVWLSCVLLAMCVEEFLLTGTGFAVQLWTGTALACLILSLWCLWVETVSVYLPSLANTAKPEEKPRQNSTIHRGTVRIDSFGRVIPDAEFQSIQAKGGWIDITSMSDSAGGYARYTTGEYPE